MTPIAKRNSKSSPPISMRAIRAYAKRIAEKFAPEKIILFGSYAYGKPTEDSDVDLLVVMETRKRELDMMKDIAIALSPAPFATDLLVRRPKTMKRRIEQGDWFLKEIEEQGKVLYEHVA